jgi:hypothetical protein
VVRRLPPVTLRRDCTLVRNYDLSITVVVAFNAELPTVHVYMCMYAYICLAYAAASLFVLARLRFLDDGTRVSALVCLRVMERALA